MTRTVQRRTRDALVLVLLIPILLGVATLWLERRNDENLRWVAHSQDVLRSVNRMVARGYQAESNQRGFLLTGDSSFLTMYRQYTQEEWSELRRFGRYTADNPAQQEYARQWLQLWTERAGRMDQVLRMRDKSKAFTPEMAALLRQGRTLMEQMTSVATGMLDQENTVLRKRVAAQQRTELALAWLFALAVLVNLGLLYWAYRLIRNYGRARDRADAELRLANAELERRVEDRTSELRSVNENLLRSNEDLTRFAYVASHDLQEPLRTVGSYAGLLARRYEGQLDAQADKYIGFIVSGAKRMQNMVQDLLLYSRAGTQQLKLTPVDLNALVEQIEQNVRVTIREAGARIVKQDLPVIQADEGKITMVLQNLISNAIKFRDPARAPLVVLSGEPSGDEWVVTVRDNGIGFAPEYAERIFVIFQRLHQVGEYPGTGIGLAICRRIVEGHGGRIWAESTPGEGSIFSFSVPFESHGGPRTSGPRIETVINGGGTSEDFAGRG